MVTTFIMLVTLTLASGETVEAIGDVYTDYDVCVRQSRIEVEAIRKDIRKNPRIFKEVAMRCERGDLEGAVIDDDNQ